MSYHSSPAILACLLLAKFSVKNRKEILDFVILARNPFSPRQNGVAGHPTLQAVSGLSGSYAALPL